jgi:phosphatidate cytidylyltransferase
MNNFIKRLIFGGIYVALIFVATWYNPKIYTLIFSVLMFFSIYEFQKMEKIKSIFSYFLGASMVLIFYIFNFHFLDSKINHNYIITIFILSLFIPFIIALVSKNKNNLNSLKSEFFIFVYIIIPFFLMLTIPFIQNKNYDNQIMLGIFILIWINDTFAYLIGKKFGKNKLFERISPKKTIEGFAGGFIFALIGGFIISNYFTNLKPINWIVIALIASIFGSIGDLIESMFKRNAKIKDSSNLIPGHGGFLDRLDSIIFATPFIFIYLITIT